MCLKHCYTCETTYALLTSGATRTLRPYVNGYVRVALRFDIVSMRKRCFERERDEGQLVSAAANAALAG